MFFLSFMLLMAIPLSNAYKLSKAVTDTELNNDIINLNKGRGIFHLNYHIEKNDEIIKLRASNEYGNQFYNKENVVAANLSLTESEFETLTKNYIQSFNRYANSKIQLSTKELMALAFTNDELPSDQSWNWRKNVHYKIDEIQRLKYEGWYYEFTDNEGFMVLGGFLAMFALLVWIFKQIFWKYYVFGFVAILLTPMLIGLVGLIFFEVFDFNEENVFGLVYLAYFAVFIKIITALLSKQSNKSAIVSGMYLQLALPFLPAIIFVNLMSTNFLSSFNDEIVIIYLISWIVGLLSIAMFKYVYKRLSVLPSKK